MMKSRITTVELKMEEKKNNPMEDLASYLKDEARLHVKHWKDIKREIDRLYAETEEKTKKIILKNSSVVKEEDFVILHEYTHKIQMLNMEAVKVNSRILLLVQIASSFGIDLEFDTTSAVTVKSIMNDKSAGFVFYDDRTRLRYADNEMKELFHDISVKEVKSMGVVQAFDLLKSQYAEFEKMKQNATSQKKADKG